MGGGKEAGAAGAPPRRPKTKRLVEHRLSGQVADGCTQAIVRQTWVVCTAAVLVVLAFLAGAGVTAWLVADGALLPTAPFFTTDLAGGFRDAGAALDRATRASCRWLPSVRARSVL